MRQREAQHPHKQVIAQPPEHALAQEALVDVDDVFEGLVDDDQQQEDGAECKQIFQLIEFKPEIGLREIAALDRLVQDDLGQVQKDIEEGEGCDGEDQKDDLILLLKTF